MSSDLINDYIISIPKPQLAQLPMAKFHGHIIVIDRPEQVDESIAILREAEIIGFDTETRPSFKKGALNEVALLQLAVPGTCFLFRINRIGMLPQIIDLLQDPECLKVGLSIHDDFLNLHRLAEFSPEGFIDLQAYVKQFHIADNSLTRIHAILYGERVSKGQRLTNWEAETLTESQKEYASLDASACIRIYTTLSRGEFNPLESPYLQSTHPSEQETF